MLAARAKAISDSQRILSLIEQVFYSVASLEVAENQRWPLTGAREHGIVTGIRRKP